VNLGENAEVSYNPEEGEPDRSGGIQGALNKAQNQLAHRKGVHGMGMSKTPSGQDAIVVYVENERVLSQLPSDVDGFPVVGEVTGEIRTF
jgi:hypothetical protein